MDIIKQDETTEQNRIDHYFMKHQKLLESLREMLFRIRVFVFQEQCKSDYAFHMYYLKNEQIVLKNLNNKR